MARGLDRRIAVGHDGSLYRASAPRPGLNRIFKPLYEYSEKLVDIAAADLDMARTALFTLRGHATASALAQTGYIDYAHDITGGSHAKIFPMHPPPGRDGPTRVVRAGHHPGTSSTSSISLAIGIGARPRTGCAKRDNAAGCPVRQYGAFPNRALNYCLDTPRQCLFSGPEVIVRRV
ncbi:MAG: hypothetical protein GDA36_01080 [Rhodobacteraceae bacterium]|nr:hypothetical protein [Paracoccaceae bacterium]